MKSCQRVVRSVNPRRHESHYSHLACGRRQSEETLSIHLAIRERRKTDMIALARSIPGNENLARNESIGWGYSSFHGGFYESNRR